MGLSVGAAPLAGHNDAHYRALLRVAGQNCSLVKCFNGGVWDVYRRTARYTQTGSLQIRRGVRLTVCALAVYRSGTK